jgi:hypothetical protein
VSGTEHFELTLVPGARELLADHARELPQRDDLCGAFCGALALQAAGIASGGPEPLDQDAVALAAGSLISAVPNPGILPHGETGRRDYRVALPTIEDGERSGTTAAGVREAIESLSTGALAAIPFSGPWNVATVDGLFELASSLAHPVTLIANLATHHLWGSHPSPAQVLEYLSVGTLEGPPPDWSVGHFACVVARASGPGGNLYALADTYPALGSRGVHLQPAERLAAALDRRDMPAGGLLFVAAREEADAVRAGARRLGLIEANWDNGTPSAEEVA